MKTAFRSALPWTATLTLALGSLLSLGCSDSGDDTESDGKSQQAVLDYAKHVEANYADALAGAEALHEAVHELTENPSDKTLKAARDAWLAAREPYGLSEGYRFYQGPIDNDDSKDDVDEGPEGLINSWPMDESYIDYVVEIKDGEVNVSNGGIINSPEEFPEIDEQLLIDENAKDGEDSISTGYHAIEFLLWGQDLSVDGPGDRPYTDFVVGEGGTAENQDRRGAYLRVAADLLVENLTQVHDAWREGEDNYRAAFEKADPRESLAKMLTGIGSLSSAELAGERMFPAFNLQDQENEHSCFSDNTLADLRGNAVSIQNVLLGTYGEDSGVGVDQLIEAKDPKLAQKLRDQIQDAIDAIDAIPAPFDQAILAAEDEDGPKNGAAAIKSLQDFAETLVEAAQLLDVTLELE
jgi:putative iron-regulated protein